MAIKPAELNVDINKHQGILDTTIEYIDSQFKNETHTEFEVIDPVSDKTLKIFEVILKLDKTLTNSDIEYISNAYINEGWTECNIWYNHWSPNDPNSRISVPNGALIFQLVKE
jgi:hypothetical protein